MVDGCSPNRVSDLLASSIRLMAIITAANMTAVIDHPHGGNHGVERKDSVQHHDLRPPPVARPLTLGRVGAIFSLPAVR